MPVLRDNAAGKSVSTPLKAKFDRRLKLQLHDAKPSSDGGLLLFRELDDAAGLSQMTPWKPRENRTGRNARHQLFALIRQSVFGHIAEYDDLNDAGRLACEAGGHGR